MYQHFFLIFNIHSKYLWLSNALWKIWYIHFKTLILGVLFCILQDQHHYWIGFVFEKLTLIITKLINLRKLVLGSTSFRLKIYLLSKSFWLRVNPRQLLIRDNSFRIVIWMSNDVVHQVRCKNNFFRIQSYIFSNIR